MSSEKESVSSPMSIEKYSLVLVDVAGTTTSIDFVKDTLFPFVVKQAEPFLQEKWEEESIKDCIKLIKGDADLDLAAAVERVKALTQEDSSNKGLKTLQGLIYKDGYEKGELKAHVFDDVPEAFETWAKNRRVAIYSTGSVDSQKLLFSNTVKGDLSAHISKYFDQSVGPKTEAESYKKIATETEAKPEEIVFITDDPKEATAAKSGGLAAVLIIREGNSPLPEEISKEFTTISSFKDFDKTLKRKIEEAPTSEEAPPSKLPKTDVEEKPTEEKAESMEVDAGKPEATETAQNETEQPTEKTENKEETKEVTESEEKMETVVEETKAEVATEEVNATTEQEKPTETEEPKEVEAAKTEEPKADDAKPEDPKPEEEKPTEEAQVPEEKPAEEAPEKTETEEVKVDTTDAPVENGEEKTEAAEKTEEKENKSVLANGVENGKEESETVTDAAESAEVKVDEVEKSDEAEVKVKKLEESAESKTVSVEV
ncbi:enolase-phosphatase E1 [Tribolium castaneum]|uniref:enolase-phosphatase E1 n=1 Tax=Tribolium castaneum TaxID=7070 RepID=UPI0000D56A2A|nr:PREDICTED: enolase-phosphatase E1 [Tribolium castaneum]|eukprot:XP_975603.1 PREDICTED: enolase-phosphatase E1 [Tribolium castaneum]